MKRRGFTLVEIMIVVTVLAILAAIVVGRYVGTQDQAYHAHAQSFAKSLQSACSIYLANRKQYPTSFFQWVALSDGASTMNYVRLDGAARRQLENPSADVANSDYTTLTLRYKNGLVATYTLGADGQITATYTGPGAS